MGQGQRLVTCFVGLVLVGCALGTPAVQTPEGVPSAPSPASLVSSGVVEKMGLEDLVAGADIIVVGVVVETRARWNDERTLIFTEVRFEVQDTVVGPPGVPTISLVIPGGQVGEVTQEVSAAAQFTIGDRAMLFLVRTPEGDLRIAGGFQGRLAIENDVVLGLDMPLPALIEQVRAAAGGRATVGDTKDQLPSPVPTESR